MNPILGAEFDAKRCAIAALCKKYGVATVVLQTGISVSPRIWNRSLGDLWTSSLPRRFATRTFVNAWTRLDRVSMQTGRRAALSRSRCPRAGVVQRRHRTRMVA